MGSFNNYYPNDRAPSLPDTAVLVMRQSLQIVTDVHSEFVDLSYSANSRQCLRGAIHLQFGCIITSL